MIRCVPKSICSWNFYLNSKSAGLALNADLDFNFWTEQGQIRLNGQWFEIRKHGPLSGHWTLEDGKSILASAHKLNPFTRSIQVQAQGTHFVLSALHPFTRASSLKSNGQTVATITPDHPFTRRSKIGVNQKWVDGSTLAFAFWLVVVLWRRAARSSNSNS